LEKSTKRILLAALAAGPIVAFPLAVIIDSETEIAQQSSFSYFALSLFFFPLIEETAFRGVIQPWLNTFHTMQRRLFGISYANIVTSVLFSLIHLRHHHPIWAGAVFFPSLVLGYLREITGGIRIPFVVHAFYNLCWLVAEKIV
jgi:membrane protease YdiL (CAAX protease family)